MSFGLFLLLSGIVAIFYGVVVAFSLVLMSVADTSWFWRVGCFIPFINIFVLLLKYKDIKTFYKGMKKEMKFWLKAILSPKIAFAKDDEELEEGKEA